MKMSVLKKSLVASAAVAVMSIMGAGSALAATADATASVNIQTPLTVTKTQDLDFGTVLVDGTAQTVALSAAGVLTCGTGYTCSGTPAVAKFTLNGSSGATVSSISAAVQTQFSDTNVVLASPTVSATSATLTGGTANIDVGASVNVAAAVTAGAKNDAVIRLTANY